MAKIFRALVDTHATFSFNSEHVRHRVINSEEDDNIVNTPDINIEDLCLLDEEIYNGIPFKLLAKSMVDLTGDEKIMKKILVEGNGDSPKTYSTVKIFYNGFLQYADEPFESNYHKNPRKFVVNDGKILPGLDYGVQSMKLNEKAQFLIHPDYAYRNACNSTIPPNSTILFEVELIEIIDTATIVSYQHLSEQDQNRFDESYKYALALCEKANNEVKNDEKSAVKDFHRAVTKLKKTEPNDAKEAKEKRKLLLRLYTNLLICFTRSRLFKKGCENAEEVYTLTKNGSIMPIPAKVFFNHAKCLRNLQEFDKAKIKINKALKLEPKNPQITGEVLNLKADIENSKIKSKQLVAAFF